MLPFRPGARVRTVMTLRTRWAAVATVLMLFGVALVAAVPAGRPAGASGGGGSTPAVRPMCGTPMHMHINATPTTGTVPLLVAFSPNITGGCAPYQVEWSFGDGAQSEANSPHHTYKSVGNFTVYAEASGSGGGSAETQTQITVLGGPGNTTLTVEGTPLSGVAPLPVELWANATGGNLSSGVAITWSFGDGGHGAGTPIQYVYGHAGNFTAIATLTVNNRTVTNSSLRIQVERPVAPPPVDLALAANPAVAVAPANITFLASSNGDAANDSLRVCFGVGVACADGPHGWTGVPPAGFPYLYTSAGNFSAVATLTNSTGAVVAVASAAVTITQGPPLALTANSTVTSGAAPLDAGFLAEVSGGTPPYAVQWSFGDGEVGSSLPGVPIAHSYDRAGTFVPRVVVRDAVGQSRNVSLAPITVASGPIGTGALPSLLAGTAGWELFTILALVAAGVGVVVGRWSRQRARRRRLRREGEELVREMEETEGPAP